MSSIDVEDYEEECQNCYGEGGWATPYSGPDTCGHCDGVGYFFDEESYFIDKLEEFINTDD